MTTAWIIRSPEGLYVDGVTFWSEPRRAEVRYSGTPSETFPFLRASQLRQQLRDYGYPGFTIEPYRSRPNQEL
jgi:hypothetical protein